MSETDGRRTAHHGQDRLSLPQVRLDDLLDEVRSRMSEISATQERIHTLLEAVVSIGEGLELDPLLVRITETATSLVDARYGALGVIGPDGEMSRFVPVGLEPDEIARIAHWPEGEGILGLLIKEPRPLRLRDVREHPESRGFPAGHPPMHTFLGVPIRIRDQVFGNLYMTDKRDGAEFTGDDELLLRALATAAGTAIENAQLFAQTQSRETWLDASGQITTRLLSGAPPEEVLRLVARRARVMAHADLAVIAMPGEEPDTLTVRVWDGPEDHLATHDRHTSILDGRLRRSTLRVRAVPPGAEQASSAHAPAHTARRARGWRRRPAHTARRTRDRHRRSGGRGTTGSGETVRGRGSHTLGPSRAGGRTGRTGAARVAVPGDRRGHRDLRWPRPGAPPRSPPR